MTDHEKLIDEIANRVKANRDVSDLPKHPVANYILKLARTLNSVPKAEVPLVNFDRIKNRVLDRIAIPMNEPVAVGFFGAVLSAAPRFIKIGGGVIGSFLILSSLGIGVAAVALQSVPGQPIYPVKKVVENVQLKLASDETTKTNLEIRFAQNRLEELEILIHQNQQGKVSGAQVQRAVENTAADVAKATSKISQSTGSDQPQTGILNKIVDLNAKQTALLQTAAIHSEGEVRIGLEKALEASKESQEKTIENIERAGLRVEETPVVITDNHEPEGVNANGKITEANFTSVSIGTSKFLLTDDTKFVNINKDDLKVGQTIEIKGEVIQGKTYAVEIKAQAEPESPQTVPADPTDDDSNGQ